MTNSKCCNAPIADSTILWSDEYKERVERLKLQVTIYQVCSKCKNVDQPKTPEDFTKFRREKNENPRSR